MKRLFVFVGLVLISAALIGCSGNGKTSTPTTAITTRAAVQTVVLATPTAIVVSVGACHEQPNTLPGGEILRETDSFCLIYYSRSNLYLGLMSASIANIAQYRKEKIAAEAVILSSPQLLDHKCDFKWGPMANLAGHTSSDQFTTGCPMSQQAK